MDLPELGINNCKQKVKSQHFNTASFLCSDIMNNKVFYQHPNLMRALGMHETVMEVMVNVLSGDSKVCTGGGELMAIITPMQKMEF